MRKTRLEGRSAEYLAPMRRTSYMLLGVLLAIQISCRSDQSNDANTTGFSRGFVGTVVGTDAFVALIAGGGQAVVYLCDGEVDLA